MMFSVFMTPKDPSWPGPHYLLSQKPFLEHVPCFAQYVNKDGWGKKASKAKKKNASLTSRLATSRVKQCNDGYKKFEKGMKSFRRFALASVVFLSEGDKTEWKAPPTYSSWASCPLSLEESKAEILKLVTAYCNKQETEGKEIYDGAIKFYEEKAKELKKVEKSLAKSKKTAEKTMDEHSEVITNESWSPLNNPHLLQHVLGYLTMRELSPVMQTCSNLLHFVHSQVPVSIRAENMGDTNFNKWLKKFHHFRSLNCDSYKNMKKGSMYQKLSALSKDKRFDSLMLSQPANLKPKNFAKFQQMFQKHQSNLVSLSVEPNSIPCFLSDQQLSRLQNLKLLHLNKDSENVASWVEKFPKLTSLRVLTISSNDYSLGNVSIPSSLQKLYLSSSSIRFTDDSQSPRIHGISNNPVSLPCLEEANNLEELCIQGAQDLSGLSLLQNKLKVLKISAKRDKSVQLPPAIHADELTVGGFLPPSDIIHVKTLAVVDVNFNEFHKFASSPPEDLAAVYIAWPHKELSEIVKWEHALPRGIKFGYKGKSVSFSQTTDRFYHGCWYTMLHKYALMEHAKDIDRCFLDETPIAQTNDGQFSRDSSVCESCGWVLTDKDRFSSRCKSCRKRSNPKRSDELVKRAIITKVNRMCEGIGSGNNKKRKNEDAAEGEPALKKQKMD